MRVILDLSDLRTAVRMYVMDVLGHEFDDPFVEFPQSPINPGWDGTAVIGEAEDE